MNNSRKSECITQIPKLTEEVDLPPKALRAA